MCGIAGIYSIKGPDPQREEIERMTQALAHRGPDGQGFFLEGPIAFGHRRLSIIDLESGKQPMESTSARTIVSYNGEIYNYRELRKDLISDGYRFETKSDTEVILALYEKYGMKFLQFLSGMFAIALWDRQTKKLIMVRDRIGIKPLYICRYNGRIYFASEIKSIRAAVPNLNKLNLHAVNSYFTRQYIGGRETIFESIEKLPPAMSLEISQDKCIERKYWQPEPHHGNGLSLSAAAKKLDELFDRSVKGHLVSDVPVGIFLSGGVDSSCLLAFGAQNSSEPLDTFSVGFGESSKYNEIEYARVLAKKYNTRHHEIHVTPSEVLDILPFIIKELDEPLADYAILPTYIMSRFAAERVKVVLSGEGADELFGGYKRYRFYAMRDRLPLKRIFNCKAPVGPFLFKERNRKCLLKNFVECQYLKAEVKSLEDRLFFQSAGYLNSMLYTDIKNWLVDDLLMKVDKMCMLASLEARVPYLDQNVVEFLLSLSGNLKVGLREKKRLLKAVAMSYIPLEIIQRPKHGFTVPVGEWLKGPLKKTFEEIVFDNSKISDWINLSYVGRLMQDHLQGKKKLGLRLWSIFIFSWWAEQNLS
ncbi:MAG: asparagine synthase (glutamine-hydrolyzing) [Bacteroidetes bacterium]|nr:asparagine synthase (glutamine-hydrolyzing) [Bacteroidota bacterium]